MNTKRLLTAVSKDDQKLIERSATGYCIESIVGHPHPWNRFHQPGTTTILMLDPEYHTVLYEYLLACTISTHSLSAVVLLTKETLPHPLHDCPNYSVLEKPLTSTSLLTHLTYLRTQATFGNLKVQSKLLGQMFARTSTALAITNATTFGMLNEEQSLLLNPAANRLLGIEEDEFRALDWAQLLYPNESEDMLKGIASLSTGKRYTQIIRYKQSEDSYKKLFITVITIGEWYLCSMKPIESGNSNSALQPKEYLENQLAYDAHNHTPSRRALIHINLSAIHAYRLIHGLQSSQEVVNRVERHLKQYSTSTCILCKSFEHHYTFYHKECTSRQGILDFCQTLGTDLKTLIQSDGIACGIGLLMLPRQQKPDYDTAMHEVLLASEEALNLKRNWLGFYEFSKELKNRNRRKEIIITELAQIAAGQKKERLYVVFQPIVTLATNRITEFEVLARLNSDQLGPVKPSEFIPLAEQTKYIIPLGYQIIEHALHFLATLHEQLLCEVTISINISVVQLMEADFLARLLALIEQSGVTSSHICLEITESSLMTNFEEINTLFAELHMHGITIALDDFGTGYSSLCHEQNLVVDTLKIDKAFIDRLAVGEPSITGNIITMGHTLGHTIIAEGVETPYQRKYLIEHQCDKIQGYLISTPLCMEKALQVLQTYPTSPL
ncbi:MAG: EAL domain-containing protein [Sphaerochaeta sp.]|nr:EAL domain-containing protein [Sphaerochaeta sp.]